MWDERVAKALEDPLAARAWVYHDCVGDKQDEDTDQGQEATVSNDQDL